MKQGATYAVTFAIPEIESLRDLAHERSKAEKDPDERSRWRAVSIRLEHIVKKLKQYERRTP